jgi:preprotein translocase subunit YajC
MLQFVLLLNKAHVKGHWRTTPTGQRVYVSPHERQDQEGYDPSQLPLFGAPAARPPEPAPPPKPEPEPEPEPEPVPTPEPEPEPEPVQAETTPATIPEYVKDAVKLNAERIHYFNEEVERLRKLGQRFGSPGRYEYEYRTEHEHQFDANVDKLKYIEGLAEKNGFSLEQLYAHVEGGRPEKIPWSMAASAWGRPREPKTTPEPTPPPAPAPEPEPTATTPEPWQMTRREFRHAENAPKVQAIQAAIRAGKRITAVTQLRVTPLTSPEHIRLTSTGHVQTRERTTWVNMTDDMVDTLAAQAGMKLPDFMEKVYHRAEVAQALKEGKPVPPEVLAEYPELSSQEDEEPEEAPPAIQHRPLTEDAIHNWDAPYIQKQYGEHPEEIRQAAMQAMRRHHQKGTSAREEAQALNAQFGLTKEPEPTPTPEPVDTTTAQLDQAEHDLGDLEGDVASTERAHTADTEDEQDDDAEGDGDEGEQTFSLITGRTYPLRRDLVSLGARWHADEKGYIVPTGKAEQVEAYARSKGLTVGKVDLPAEDYHREKLTGEALRAHRQAGLDKKITRWRSQAARLEKQAAALEARLKPYDDMQFWTEPLKPDHYSYNRHRNLRERLRAMMDKRMGMLRDAHALRQKADGWDRAGAQIAGDRERQRQAQREMVSSQVTVGSRIHDAIYGKGTVVKVNPKTFTVRYDNGHTSATDKSHAMPLGETVPLAELKEQTRPKYKKGDTVRFNSFGQDRVGTITSVGPRSYSIRVHGAVQTSPLKVDHQRVLGPDTTPEPAPAAAPSAPLRRGQFVRFTHGVLSSTPRYGTITNVGPDTYTIRAMDGGRILEVNHKDVMAKARNTPRLVLLLNKAMSARTTRTPGPVRCPCLAPRVGPWSPCTSSPRKRHPRSPHPKPPLSRPCP